MTSRAIEFGLNKLGFKSIRENQRKVIEAYLAGRDVLMIAPTGSGKSLTFQISPYVIDNFKHGDQQDVRTVCLVIAPLVSLMKDQVSFLRRKQVNDFSHVSSLRNTAPKRCLLKSRLGQSSRSLSTKKYDIVSHFKWQ